MSGYALDELGAVSYQALVEVLDAQGEVVCTAWAHEDSSGKWAAVFDPPDKVKMYGWRIPAHGVSADFVEGPMQTYKGQLFFTIPFRLEPM